MGNIDKVTEFKEIAKYICEMYEIKNKGYGDSFGQTVNKFGIISAITRISDKYNRIVSLATSNNVQIIDTIETMEDTLKDLAAYSIMTIMALKEHTPTNQ